MPIPFRKLLLASSLSAGLVAGVCNSASADTQNITEARQETQIWTTFALNPYLRATDLQVNVHDGKATLSGKVPEDVNRDLAEQIALGVKGVKEVDNKIVIEADYVYKNTSPEPSYYDVIDNTTVATAIRAKLMWSKSTTGLDTSVNAESGKVILRGTVATQEAKNLAGLLALNTHGVVSVDNQIKVESKASRIVKTLESSADDAGKDIADSWITTKIKSTFLYSTNVDGSSIEVNTNNGNVVLKGKVHSGAERSLAIELAGNVLGVKSVSAKDLGYQASVK